MGKFRQFLTELSARDTSIFSFPDDNLSEYQWIFTKLGICIDIVEIWFEMINGQISSILDSYLPATRPYFRFRMITSKYRWVFTKLGIYIDIVEIWFGVTNG